MAEEKAPKKVTDIDAVHDNVKQAVESFAMQWEPAPKFTMGVEVMSVAQLRNALGLRASIDWGDPWPEAEQLLLQKGFRWQMLFGQRIMMVMEKPDFVPETGWEEAEETL